ncbi:MAG: sigma-70 family RNA polymerase sigma factor [Planctomycetota bacterium]
MEPLDESPPAARSEAESAPLDPALAQVVERWRGPLVGLARAWRVARPVELAQDAFAELWLTRERFEGDWNDEPAVGAWLRGIAWNLAAADRRRAARRPRPIDDAEPPASDSSGLHAGLARDERAALLRAAIEELPNDQRTVVAMAALERTPLRRVAALLGLTERAVEGRLYRARKELARRLEGLKEEVTP